MKPSLKRRNVAASLTLLLALVFTSSKAAVTVALVPLLARPGWLSPMALGVVAIDVAVSLRSHQSAPRRRRS